MFSLTQKVFLSRGLSSMAMGVRGMATANKQPDNLQAIQNIIQRLLELEKTRPGQDKSKADFVTQQPVKASQSHATEGDLTNKNPSIAAQGTTASSNISHVHPTGQSEGVEKQMANTILGRDDTDDSLAEAAKGPEKQSIKTVLANEKVPLNEEGSTGQARLTRQWVDAMAKEAKLVAPEAAQADQPNKGEPISSSLESGARPGGVRAGPPTQPGEQGGPEKGETNPATANQEPWFADSPYAEDLQGWFGSQSSTMENEPITPVTTMQPIDIWPKRKLAPESQIFNNDDLLAEYKRTEEAIERRQKHCPICTNQIVIDYKNVRLLSQFVSDRTGMILPSKVTGVCLSQQRKLAKAIKKARAAGLMPHTSKLPQYKKDPKPYRL